MAKWYHLLYNLMVTCRKPQKQHHHSLTAFISVHTEIKLSMLTKYQIVLSSQSCTRIIVINPQNSASKLHRDDHDRLLLNYT